MLETTLLVFAATLNGACSRPVTRGSEAETTPLPRSSVLSTASTPLLSASGDLPTSLPASSGSAPKGAHVPFRTACETLLRAASIPHSCSNPSPAEQAACTAEASVKIIDARIETRKVAGLRQLRLEIPELQQSLVLSEELLPPVNCWSEAFSASRFSSLTCAKGEGGQRFEFCSTPTRAIIATVAFGYFPEEERRRVELPLPEGSRLRFPDFKLHDPGIVRAGSPCAHRCTDGLDTCSRSCRLKHANAWGELNELGLRCSTACTAASTNCTARCAALGQFP
jgi:hypothetical protein